MTFYGTSSNSPKSSSVNAVLNDNDNSHGAFLIGCQQMNYKDTLWIAFSPVYIKGKPVNIIPYVLSMKRCKQMSLEDSKEVQPVVQKSPETTPNNNKPLLPLIPNTTEIQKANTERKKISSGKELY